MTPEIPVWRRVQGDINDTITGVLNGVQDLAAATAVEAHVWRRDSLTTETLAAAITDPVARTVVVQLGGAAGWLSDAAVANWLVDVEVLFADGTTLSWPAGPPGVIAVRTNP